MTDALTYADAPGEDAYLHDELIWCDDTPDGKQSMAVWRREAGLRVRPARKSNMRRLSYEWLAGLREICIDPERAPLAYEERSTTATVTGRGWTTSRTAMTTRSTRCATR